MPTEMPYIRRFPLVCQSSISLSLVSVCHEGDDLEDKVWRALDGLPSFCTKGSFPKLSRWFSWNCVAKMHMQEFSALQMLLEYTMPEGEEDQSRFEERLDGAGNMMDPIAQLRALKAMGGGLRLTQKIMRWRPEILSPTAGQSLTRSSRPIINTQQKCMLVQGGTHVSQFLYHSWTAATPTPVGVSVLCGGKPTPVPTAVSMSLVARLFELLCIILKYTQVHK